MVVTVAGDAFSATIVASWPDRRASRAVDTSMSIRPACQTALGLVLVTSVMLVPSSPAGAQPAAPAAAAPASVRTAPAATALTGVARRVKIRGGASRRIKLTPTAVLRAPFTIGAPPFPGQVTMLDLTAVRADRATELEVFLGGPFGPVPLGLVPAGPTASNHLLAIRTELRAGPRPLRLLLRARPGVAVSVGALSIRADWPAEQAKLASASLTTPPAPARTVDVVVPLAITSPSCATNAARAPEVSVPMTMAPAGIELLRGMGEVSPGLLYTVLLLGTRVADGTGLLVDVDLDVPHGASSKRARLGTIDVGAGLSVALPATQAMAPYMGVDLTQAKPPTLVLTLRDATCRSFGIDAVRLTRDAQPPPITR